MEAKITFRIDDFISNDLYGGAPRAKPVAPYFTPQWGDIPAKRWRIHPRPKAVAFCCRGKKITWNLKLNKRRIRK
jgi:hypothetical protein